MATSTKKSPSTAVAKVSSSNLVSIQDAMRAQLASLASRVAPPSGAAIRITQDKMFVLPDGTKTAGPLQLVIVDFTSKNAFYEGSFDSKNITPPACFAIGLNPQKLTPSENSPVIQSKDCNSCPNNQFGSAGAGKACKNMRLMAVLPPDADADTPIWTLATSPTANKAFDAYVTSIQRVFQTMPVGVVTTVGFDPGETFAKLVFSGATPNPNLESHFSRQPEAAEMLAAEPDVSQFVKTAPARGAKTAARR